MVPVAVSERRTKQNYADARRYLVEECCLEAVRISPVQDHLNAHSAGALRGVYLVKSLNRIQRVGQLP